MSGFGSDWLALREAVDGSSRSRELAALVPRSLPAIVDLGTGTGANLRWLAPRLGADQHWRLLDDDEDLLRQAGAMIRGWAAAAGFAVADAAAGLHVSGPGFDCSIRTEAVDLSRELKHREWPDGCLVTASALLDLVSRDWLEDLAAAVAARSASVLFALSFDGAIAIDPKAADDETIVALVNRHQRTDKGFGPALGPAAWRVAGELLEGAGLTVRTAATPWHCGGADAALLEPLIAGWAEAAMAVAPARRHAIEAWRERRLAEAAGGALRLTVGHRDLVALAPARGAA